MRHRRRTDVRQKQKMERFLTNQRELHALLNAYGQDILNSDNFIKTNEYIQHGDMTVNKHCINVAIYSLAISRKLGINCKQKDLIRGALLHDYFLYDWHDKEHRSFKGLHGFYHPGVALKNASKEYRLTSRERDIIKKHMWPLTVVPPQCREAWIVTAADKYCSLLETIHLHKGTSARKYRKLNQQNMKVKVQY